jgi:hypothetical protein
MPSSRVPANQRNLGLRFLNTILPEVGRSRRDRLLNDCGRMGLTYSYEGDLGRTAAGPNGSRSYSLSHVLEMLSEFCLRL